MTLEEKDWEIASSGSSNVSCGSNLALLTEKFTEEVALRYNTELRNCLKS
jgi:hypothetical protein